MGLMNIQNEFLYFKVSVHIWNANDVMEHSGANFIICRAYFILKKALKSC